ncbi:MAG TPA: DinB family protein [Candidatus Acidoferrales bacterium]|jgi:uncharacterized damage-inducible protein DinB|nr:DinB family protein [Candidatus Acidoferrales bacterium]
MTPAERERAIASLAETRQRLLATAQRLSPSQLAYKPAPDRWSAAECIEHVILVESAVLGMIQKTVAQAGDSLPSGAADEALVAQAADRSQRLNAPDRLVPTGRFAHHELLSEFEATRKRTSEFTVATDANLRQSGFPHPVFGPLDCYQWLLLIPAHGERHRAQVEEVMASPDFPRAASAG